MRLIEPEEVGAAPTRDLLEYLDEITADASTRILRELESHLRADPGELGWSEWWRRFIRMETSMEEVSNLKERVEERLQPGRR